MDLKQFLLSHTDKISKSAEALCTDKAFVYDTVYLAVIKTKRKYKKLANKERAVDVCVSLMKQPKKRVKESFSSVEDCIDKALAAKVIPWKSILSAVAVVLAAAMILPLCLPEKPTYIDPKGFVMDGTQGFANRMEYNDIVLQNFHELTALGIADPWEIACSEMSDSGLSGAVEYYTHTTAKGDVFLLQAYVNGTTKTAELILYKADVQGWIEVGRDCVRFEMDSFSSDGSKWKTYYSLSAVNLVSDSAGNLFIVSGYNGGIQIHGYDTRGNFALLAQHWMDDDKKIFSPAGYNAMTVPANTFAFYSPEKKCIDILYNATTALASFDSLSTYANYLLSFDPSTQSFSTPIPIENTTGESDSVYDYNHRFLVPDGDSGFYLVGTEHSMTSADLEHYVFHVDECGKILAKIHIGTFVGTPTPMAISPLFLDYNNGELHLVIKNGTSLEHRIYKDDEEVSCQKIQIVTTDSHDCIGFFFHKDTLHYMLAIENRYIVVAKVIDEAAEKVAEFELPITFDAYYHTLRHARHLDVSQGAIALAIGQTDETQSRVDVVSSYFIQVVFD